MGDADTTDALAAVDTDATGSETQESTQSQPEGDASGVFDSLPNEQREYLKGKNWNDLEKVVKGAQDFEKFARKSVKDMTPEEKTRFMKKLGDRPESPDGYELSDVQLPESLGYGAEAQQKFRSFVHEIGLTADQAKATDEWAKKNALAMIAEAKRQQAKRVERNETDIRGEWGSDYDTYKAQVVALAQRFGGDEAVKFVQGPGKTLQMWEWLRKVSNTMLEDTFERGDTVTNNDDAQPSTGLDWSKELAAAGIRQR